MSPHLIALEEHFFSDKADMLKPQYELQFKHVPGLHDKLHDLDSLRLQHMDKGNVSLQIVSHAPGSMATDQCKAANDQLAAAVKKNPQRFAGFAVLPVSNPEDCAAELTRCIRELGFVGALIDNKAKGDTFFDGDEYLPMWQAAQDLDVPVYLHPTWPSEAANQLLYSGNFSKAATQGLGAGGWGWHSDVGLHVLRLFASGLFDKLPKLKIIIGHMGEMIPFMLERINWLSPRWGERQRKFQEVYDANIWITTSGVWSVNPMATILRNTKIDHILFSVDYPFVPGENELGLKFMQDLEESGLVNDEQLHRIAYKNAEELMRVKATKTFD